MTSSVAAESIRIEFPDLSPADAAKIAQEFKRELLSLNVSPTEVTLVRTNPEAMDLGAMVLVAAGSTVAHDIIREFVKGSAHEAGARLFAWLCQKYDTRASIKVGERSEIVYGKTSTLPGYSRVKLPADLVDLGVVILGASSFPDLEGLDNPRFASSATLAKLIFGGRLTVFRNATVVDLFDKDVRTSDIVDAIDNLLAKSPNIRDLVIYYCGHGSFLKDKSYYLFLKGTRRGREASTGLKLRDLRHDLEERLLRKRLYVFLDSCFAGEAVKEFQFDPVGVNHMVEAQVREALPASGWAVITASSATSPAIAPHDASFTMFTGALGKILAEKRHIDLSLGDLVAEARHSIHHRYGLKAVMPECHVPRQDQGDVSRIPFFIRNASLLEALKNANDVVADSRPLYRRPPPGSLPARSPEAVRPDPTSASSRAVDPADPCTWGRIGRNDQCPCGSSKKYKLCHGRYC